MQGDPLNAAEATRRRREALAHVESNHQDWLFLARMTAERIAREKGEVCADDVRAELYPRGIRPRHPNAWGSVFKGNDWEWTGEYRRSAVPEGHGNMQRVWRRRCDS